MNALTKLPPRISFPWRYALAAILCLAVTGAYLLGRSPQSAAESGRAQTALDHSPFRRAALREPRLLALDELQSAARPLPETASGPDYVRCQATGNGQAPNVTIGYPQQQPLWSPAGSHRLTPSGQGSYLEPGRTPHVPEYRLRVDDVLEILFRQTREETARPYELNVGDQVRIECIADVRLNRDLTIQPDGNITLPLLGEVRATRKTAQQLRNELEQRYEEFYKKPGITVTPLQTDTRLRDLINTVDSRFGAGGQRQTLRVTPEGTITLTGLGTVPAQGLTLDELKQELNHRYATLVSGLEVQPVLASRAARYVYVLGEVREPGRYTLEGPTNIMQAISLARGWNVGANLWQVVIFRRGPDWQLTATCLDLWDALYGNRTCPVDELWLADSDVVIVPKQKILVWDEFINLIFTRGIYGVIPFQGAAVNFAKLSSI